MKRSWEEFRDKVLELKAIFKNKNEGMETEVEILLPGEEGYDSPTGLPYVRIRYLLEGRSYERKIELYEYHLRKELRDLIHLIEHFVQEFEMEIDQSEYGGG